MPEIRDVELLKTADEHSPLGYRRRAGVWIAIALLIAAALVGYLVFGRTHAPEKAAEAPKPVQVVQEPVKPLGGEPDAIELPPLDESDAIIRQLVAKLSAHPAVAAWLTTDGLIRNFTVVVANIAESRTPAVHLRALRPASQFQVVERGGQTYVDPHSYQRYDRIAAAAASIDPAGAARLYATVKPRIEEAYRDLGAPDQTFDRALERAIVMLLKTPVLTEPVPVQNEGATGFAYADPAIEGLTAARKQLLRMGPDNVRTIQSSLRAIAIALGIPEERFPPTR